MRQDPDVIFIGEVWDSETANTVVQAASTGHLVLSTLHTTHSFGTIARLLFLGMNNKMIVDTLKGAIGQRLVRKLCRNCKIQKPLTSKEKKRYGSYFSKNIFGPRKDCFRV